MKNLKVSIIIPSFNKELYIAETIRAVTSQTYSNWELIIVDDHSTDSSWKILSDYSETDDRIILLQRDSPIKGGSVCRNIGLSKARGDVVFFLDADDLITKDCLERRLQLFSVNCDLDFMVFPTGTFNKSIGDSGAIWYRGYRQDYLKEFLIHDIPWTISSVMWRKKALDQLQGFDESFERLQDVELHTRAIIGGLKFKYIYDKELINFYYRISEDRSVSIHSEIDLNRKYIKSFSQYVKVMKSELYNSPTNWSNYERYLKGSIFELYKRILTSGYRSQKIPKSMSIQLLRDFRLSQKEEGSNASGTFLRIYSELFKVGMWRVKGFNWMSKWIYVTFNV